MSDLSNVALKLMVQGKLEEALVWQDRRRANYRGTGAAGMCSVNAFRIPTIWPELSTSSRKPIAFVRKIQTYCSLWVSFNN